jgi:hypothetical protein
VLNLVSGIAYIKIAKMIKRREKRTCLEETLGGLGFNTMHNEQLRYHNQSRK